MIYFWMFLSALFLCGAFFTTGLPHFTGFMTMAVISMAGLLFNMIFEDTL